MNSKKLIQVSSHCRETLLVYLECVVECCPQIFKTWTKFHFVSMFSIRLLDTNLKTTVTLLCITLQLTGKECHSVINSASVF